MTRTNRFKSRLGNTALGRHVRREWADPDVRQATKDAGILYGTYKVTQHLPRLQAKAQRRYAAWRNPPPSAWNAGEMLVQSAKKIRPRRGLSMLKHGEGLVRRYAGATATKRGRNVLKLLRVVR